MTSTKLVSLVLPRSIIPKLVKRLGQPAMETGRSGLAWGREALGQPEYTVAVNLCLLGLGSALEPPAQTWVSLVCSPELGEGNTVGGPLTPRQQVTSFCSLSRSRGRGTIRRVQVLAAHCCALPPSPALAHWLALLSVCFVWSRLAFCLGLLSSGMGCHNTQLILVFHPLFRERVSRSQGAGS